MAQRGVFAYEAVVVESDFVHGEKDAGLPG